jgi:enamine deaminase RidA (YjgF/YER057c/UK114 family)
MSRAVIHAGVVYTAGHVDGAASDVAGQTEAILAKIEALLTEAGTDKSNVISANVYLSDIAGFEEMNGVWDRWVDPFAPPARTTVESKLAGPQYKVEISVIAAMHDLA